MNEMKTSKIIKAAHQLSKPYRITNGKNCRLKDVDPVDTGELKSADKPRAKEALQNGVEAMAEALQIFALDQRLEDPYSSARFAQVAGEQTAWKYRGQIRRDAREMDDAGEIAKAAYNRSRPSLLKCQMRDSGG